MNKIPESIMIKALAALEQWTITFKIMGNGGDETPRYAQLMMKEDDKYVLHSTQKKLFYDLGLTREENRFLIDMDTDTLWREWKEARTNYLLKNHPTISVY
jgi:hypothetical protein